MMALSSATMALRAPAVRMTVTEKQPWTDLLRVDDGQIMPQKIGDYGFDPLNLGTGACRARTCCGNSRFR